MLHRCLLLSLLLSLQLISKLVVKAAKNTTEDDGGIDELEAVVEFDESDDLFKFLSERDSACVHLYSRKD